jgi:calcineurin-like phosphoesterase family protein
MAVHFVADLHFDGPCERYAHPRGFADGREMNRTICEMWCARVAPEDSVWILGHVGNPVHLAGLPGIKHLVRGHSDPQTVNCLGTGRYASVCDRRLLATAVGDVSLVYDPAKVPQESLFPVLHGKLHGDSWHRPGFVCVSIDQTGWGPIGLEEAILRATNGRRDPP